MRKIVINATIVSGVILLILSIVLVIGLSDGWKTEFESDKFSSLGESDKITFRQTINPYARSKKVSGIPGPFPTGSFWTNLIGEADFPVACYPYAIVAHKTNFGISYSAFNRTESNELIADGYVENLLISSDEQFDDFVVDEYDSLSANIHYFSLSSACTLKSYLVKGSPFLTFESQSCAIRVTTEGILEAWTVLLPDEVGSAIRLVLKNGQNWLIYAHPFDLHNSRSLYPYFVTDTAGCSVSLNLTFSGVIRIAYLPAGFQTELSLRPYLLQYPIGASVTWGVLNRPESDGFVTSRLRLSYQVKYLSSHMGDLIMLALPHHMSLLDGSLAKKVPYLNDTSSLYRYFVVKGRMTPIIGNTWTMLINETLPDVSYSVLGDLAVENDTVDCPEMDESIKLCQVKLLLRQDLIRFQNENMTNVKGVYDHGRVIGKISQLVLIADGIQDLDTRNAFIELLTSTMEPWLNGSSEDRLLYDRTYGGIIPSDGLKNIYHDFGSAYYNDHHFQYGYYLHGLSTLASFNPIFESKYRNSGLCLLMDVCNWRSASSRWDEYDETDSDLSHHFPLIRHKDFYDGHSWASGLFSLEDGKNQESISESLNGYFGAYLYGKAIGSKRLTDAAAFSFALEKFSGSFYWQISQDRLFGSDQSLPSVYDSSFSWNVLIGIMEGFDIGETTWFGDRPESCHGINLVPFSPVINDFYSKSFSRRQASHLWNRIDVSTVADEWLVVAWMNRGMNWPLASLQTLLQLSKEDDFDFGLGNSRTNAFVWIAESIKLCSQSSDCSTSFAVDVIDSWKSSVGKSCAENPTCIILGEIEGDCCPTTSNSTHACCPHWFKH